MTKEVIKITKKVKKIIEKDKKIYAFPTQSRCPRCKTSNTIATHTRGSKQYRTCRNAVCRYKYLVHGEIV